MTPAGIVIIGFSVALVFILAYLERED